MLIRLLIQYGLLFTGLLVPVPARSQVVYTPGQRVPVTFTEVKAAFQQPGRIYAPFMFWFWDTPLDNAETRDRMVNMGRVLMQQGFNPGYAHARMCMVGLPDLPRSQWLSEVWFDTFGRILDQAAKRGFYFGYNDEYWWPGGRAAGRVLKETPDLWAESLYWQVTDVKGGSRIECPESFFTVAARLAENNLTRLDHDKAKMAERARQDSLPLVPHVPATIKSATLRIIGAGSLPGWTAPDSGHWRVYSFFKYYHPGADGGRLNYLDRRLAKKFIPHAHGPYLHRFRDRLGRTLAGVFTDHEGDYGYKLAWSRDLAGFYRRKTQRDIRLWMPLLIDTDAEGRYVTARWDWFDAVSSLYASYFAEISDWLRQRDLYNVSNLWEESLMWQAGAVGDFFKVQRAFSLPGTDCLGLSVLESHDFKETASVCEFESRLFQSEIMGGAGFRGFNPVTLKQAANAVAAWGVSHVVSHGLFSTRTLDRNPWLPDWFDGHPLWPYMHLWTDFARRNSYINAHGHSAANVLLLNPMDSVWGLCGPGVFDPAFPGRSPGPAVAPLPTAQDIPRSRADLKRSSAWWTPPVMQNWFDERVVQIDNVYRRAIADLTAGRIEFLAADRYYLRRMQVAEDQLVFGPFRFDTVVLPPLFVLPLDVMEKILSFAENGGQVFYLGDLPAGSVENGLADAGMRSLVERFRALPCVVSCPSGISGRIKSHVQFVAGGFNMLQQHRKIDGRHFFWLANNTGTTQSCTLLAHGLNGAVEVWDSENGTVRVPPFKKAQDGLQIRLDFDPLGGFWLVVDPQRASVPEVPPPAVRDTAYIRLDGQWRVRIDQAVQPNLEHPTVPPGFMTQPGGCLKELELWRNWGLTKFSGYVDYQRLVFLYPFNGKTVLDLGDVKHVARVWVNGRDAGQRLWPPYCFDVSDAVKKGQNQIDIRVGNLINNSYNQAAPSGLLGPVRLVRY